jgi:hypothetical protein
VAEVVWIRICVGVQVVVVGVGVAEVVRCRRTTVVVTVVVWLADVVWKRPNVVRFAVGVGVVVVAVAEVVLGHQTMVVVTVVVWLADVV